MGESEGSELYLPGLWTTYVSWALTEREERTSHEATLKIQGRVLKTQLWLHHPRPHTALFAVTEPQFKSQPACGLQNPLPASASCCLYELEKALRDCCALVFLVIWKRRIILCAAGLL